MEYDIPGAIPHRPPFLLVDEVVEISENGIKASATLRPDDELWSRIYAGHYPGNAITPGVMLCEMIFQAAAILVFEMAKAEPLEGVPVVTRIQNVKFKTMVRPGDTVEIRASLVEKMANAFFMKGGIYLAGKAAVQAEFAVALAKEN